VPDNTRHALKKDSRNGASFALPEAEPTKCPANMTSRPGLLLQPPLLTFGQSWRESLAMQSQTTISEKRSSRFVWSPRFWFVVTSALALALDQTSKWLALKYLPLHVPQQVLGETLKFSLTMNERGLFGLSYGAPWVHYALPVVVVVLVIIFGLRSPSVWFGVALGLILGGGVGNNLIDRVRFGSVVDFIDMGIGNTRWYTYNLADAFAVAGVIMILTHEFFGWGRPKPAASAPVD
jgi:signal peptidase II